MVLTLTADAAYGLGSPNVGTVTIASDDLPPDLVVSSMSAPSTAGPDADIVVTDTTRNQGTGSSPQSNTGFYLSTDATWDAADVWLGSRQLPALGPGATNVLPTTLHVPPSTVTGSYRVLAKADWDGVVTEGNEANNVRASSTVKIGPDLIITLGRGSIECRRRRHHRGFGNHQEPGRRSGARFDDPLLLVGQFVGRRLRPGHRRPVRSCARAGGVVEFYDDARRFRLERPSECHQVIAQADAAGDVLETTENNNAKASAAVNVVPI